MGNSGLSKLCKVPRRSQCQDTQGLSTQYKVRHCSQCQGDTEFYCHTCKHDLCLLCKERHVMDLDTIHHDVVIYREKFSFIHKQEICARHPKMIYEMFCQLCDLPFCSRCLEHRKHQILDIRTAYQTKRQQHREIIYNIRSETLFNCRVLLAGIQTDIQTLSPQIYHRQSQMSTKAHRLKDLIDTVVCDVITRYRDLLIAMIRHQERKMNRHIIRIETYEDIYEQSANRAMQSLFFIKTSLDPQMKDTPNIPQHLLLSLTEEFSMEDVSHLFTVIPEIRKRQVGIDDCVKLLSTPVLHRSICVTGVSHVYHIFGITPDRVWASDFDSLILTDTTGNTLHRVTDITPAYGLHTMNSSGEVIYIDRKYSINKLSRDNKTVTTLLQSPISQWEPICVFCSPSTGELMVGIHNFLIMTGKITRYNSLGEHIMTIPHENTDETLYRAPYFITENKNGDIIVSDYEHGAVVVTERGGRHRFSYKGPLSGASLKPLGICADALSHILICDVNTHTVQMIDKDGHFLSLLLTQQHGINRPLSLNYDNKTHLLWVGSHNTNTVSVYRYIQRTYSLTGYSTPTLSISGEICDDRLSDDSDISSSDYGMHVKIEEKEDKYKLGYSTPTLSISGEICDDRLSDDSDISSSDYGSNMCVKMEKNEDKYKLGIPKTRTTKTEKSMASNKLKQSRKDGEANIRKSFSVNSKYLETKPTQLSRRQMINKEYREILYSLECLDCAGFNLVDEGGESSFQSIEPFAGYHVDGFLEWMENCKAILRKTRSTKWGSVSSVLHNVFTIESIFKFEQEVHPNIIDHSMRCAIESENYLLVSELLRTYLFDHNIQLQSLFEDIKGISPVIIDTILQTVRNLILRKCLSLQNNGIVLSFCWECGEGDRLVMVMSYRGKIEMSDRIPNEVLGFKLVLYNYSQPSDEASIVIKSIPVSKKTLLPTVTEGEAKELFKKHSNLTMISASPYKSMGYSKGKQRIVEKLCIVLFCFHKGYIPYREDRFPKQLGAYEVDVQEGYCVFGSGASLEIGGYICRAGCGSIGGFVNLPNNKTGLITCAHVIFSSEELEKMESMKGVLPGVEVKAFDKAAHTYNVCGTCTAAEFPRCFQQATTQYPNVDAALIELDPTIDTFSLRTVSSDQLYSAGFDPNSPPVFSGEVVPLSDPDPVHRTCPRIPDKLDSVVKYGVETGLTIGHLYHSGAHVRFISDSLKLPDNLRSAIMCDQIEIQNFPQGQFFECGDSGSFVFCINPDKTLSCLGMAVGLSLPQKSCLVTPIARILRSVCPPGARLKPCSSLTQQTNAQPQATLDMILAAVGSLQTNFQTSLQNVERNVQNLQVEVRTLRTQVQQNEDSRNQSPFNQSRANSN